MIQDVEFWSIAFLRAGDVIEPTAHFWNTRDEAELKAEFWRERVPVVVYRLTAHLREAVEPVALSSPVTKGGD